MLVSEDSRGIELAALAFWAFAIVHAFYTENPVRPRDVVAAFAPGAPPAAWQPACARARLTRAATGHAAAAACLAGAFGAGAVVLRWVGTGGAGAPFAVGAGLAAAVLGWFGLGLAGLWTRGIAVAAAAAGAALAVRSRRPGEGLPRWVGTAVAAAPAVLAATVPAGWLAARFAAVAPAAAAVGAGAWAGLVAFAWLAWAVRRTARGAGWIGAMFATETWLAVGVLAAVLETPERFYDAQVYHLGLPALFGMQHRVTGLPELLHASFPLGGPMLYGWLTLLGGEAAARAWRLWLTGLLLHAVYRLGARDGRPVAGHAAAALAACCPLVLLNAMQTSVDVDLCFAVVLALLAALRAREGGGRRWQVLAGILGGLGWSLKITAAFLLPGLALAAARRRRVAAAVVVFGLAAAPWALPWWGRNAVVVGNPVYPYATRLFRGGRQWEPARLARFREQAAARVVERWQDLPRLPWRLIHGTTSESFLGPALLLLLPVFLLSPPAGAAAVAGGVGALALVAWIGVSHVPRYVLPAWLLLGVAGSAAVLRYAATRPWPGRALLGVLLATGMAGLGGTAIIARAVLDPADLLAGREAAPAWLERKMINAYASVAALDRPARGRVMLVGETRGLYWNVPFVNHSVYDLEAFEEALRASRDDAEFAKRLRQRATLLFVNDRETSRLKNRFNYPLLDFSPREQPLLAGLCARWLDELADNGRYGRLFALRKTPRRTGPGPAAPLSFNPEALKLQFEGAATITWQGGGEIRMIKSAVQQ